MTCLKVWYYGALNMLLKGNLPVIFKGKKGSTVHYKITYKSKYMETWQPYKVFLNKDIDFNCIVSYICEF